jgi:hypothetical protein
MTETQLNSTASHLWRQAAEAFPTVVDDTEGPRKELEDKFGLYVVCHSLNDLRRSASTVMRALPSELRVNEDFLRMAVLMNSEVLRYVPDKIKEKPEWESFLLKLITDHDHKGMVFASVRQRQCKDFVIKAVTIWPLVLGACCHLFRSDMEVVLAAVRRRPATITDGFIAPDVLRSRSFWCRAIALRPGVIQFAPHQIRDDDEMVQLAVTKEPHMLKYARNVVDYRKIVRMAVARRGAALVHAGPTLRGDPAIVRLAIQSDSFALVYARDHLRCDRTGFVRRAALFCNWEHAKLIILGTRKHTKDSRCPFGWLDDPVMYLVLHAFAEAHTVPTDYKRFLCGNDGGCQAYCVLKSYTRVC